MKTFRATLVTATALCAVLSACASRPLYPTDLSAAVAPAPPPPPPEPPPPPPPTEPAPLSAPTAPIQSAPLAPPPGASAEPALRPAYAPPERSYAAPPAKPEPRMVSQKAPGSGPVKVEPQPSIKVKKGDTLISLSHKTGIFVADLAKENKLEEPYKLRLGAEVKVPSKRYYLVQNGDTMYSIAKRFGLEQDALSVFNKRPPDAALKAGQKLYLPLDAKDKGVPKPIMVAAPRAAETAPTEPYAPPIYTAPAPTPAPPAPPPPRPAPPPPAPATPATPQPYRPSAPPPQARPAPPSASAPIATAPPSAPATIQLTTPSSGPLGDTEVAAAGRGVFQWPVRGELINTFGQKGAIRSDGIDLGATQGDSVRSAAAGEVVYAGNVVQGFGNLVLIKHPGGWVTAYAHLQNIEVKMRQVVTQGQEIGLVGQSGGVDRPQLHFEIRYAPSAKDKARPIDPMLVLPVQ